MQIIVSEYTGLCPMAERAVDIALEAAENSTGRTFTLGRIAHNERVRSRLEAAGIYAVNDTSELNAGDTLVISAHGAPKSVYSECEALGVNVADATCPNILKIHEDVEKYSEKGYFVIVAGDKNHREVLGTLSRAAEHDVVSDPEEAVAAIEKSGADKILLAAQTTFDSETFDLIARIAQNFVNNTEKSLVILNSICYTTMRRQAEARILTRDADVTVVVGDRGSSNTLKLYGIASENSRKAYLIEDVSDLGSVVYQNNKNTKLVVLAGASTPKELTMEVIYTMTQNNTPDTELDVKTEATEETAVAEPVSEEVKTEASAEETAAANESAEEPNEEAKEETKAEEAPKAKKKGDITTMEEAMKAGFAPRSYRENQRVKVTVESLDQLGVSVSLNLGGKNDAGFIAASEMELDGSYDPANYTVGEVLEAIIIPKSDSKSKIINLSKKKYDEILVADAAVEHILKGEQFKLKITSTTKGGLLGKLGSYTIFVPASQIRMGYAKNLEDYVGKELRLRMLPPKEETPKEGEEAAPARKPNPKRIVASQRVILEEEKAQREDAFWEYAAVNNIVTGKVKRFAQKDGKYFGIFVSVMNKDCLLHISDLSWVKVDDPAEVLKINDTYEFLVLKSDRENDKVSLGYKQLQKRPYEIAAEKYHVGDVVKGKVERIKDFGAFISLEPGIDGLVHVSEISHNYVKNAADVLKVGDEVEAKIINFENNKITLSIKAVLDPEAAADSDVKEEGTETTSGSNSRIASFNKRAQGADESVKERRRRRDDRSDDEPHEYVSSSSVGATMADLFKNIDLTNFPASNDEEDKADDKKDGDKE